MPVNSQAPRPASPADTVDRKRFWDRKILAWEERKYVEPKKLLHRVFDVNWSLRTRLHIARRLVTQLAKGRTILEVGCGSARLLPDIVAAGAARYIGVDISRIALETARANAKRLAGTTAIELHDMDIADLPPMAPDICFSLGLLDWLQPEEILRMLRQIRCTYYVHSFSERCASPEQLLHRLYVHWMYGHRTKSYVPQYYTGARMQAMFSASYGEPVRLFRSRDLSFGAFVFRLPDGITPS